MATAQCTVTNRGLYLLANKDFDIADLQIGLLAAAVPAPSAIADYNFVSQLTAACAEPTVTGYTRKVGGGTDFTITLEEDDTNNRVKIIIDTNPQWTLDTGDTIYGAFVMVERGGADTADEVILVIEFAAGKPTNTGTFTLEFPTDDGDKVVATIAQAA